MKRKSLLAAAVLMGVCAVALYGAIINGFLDFTLRSAPSNPTSGARVYVSSATSLLTCILSSGASCMPSGSMTYPGSGIANSTGSAWGTSYTAQGTDTALLTAGTVSGAGSTLCVDANGGATTSGCSSSGGSVGTGGTYYVATTGSDSNPCSSSSKCLTIGHALSLIPAVISGGYTINVADGTYNECIEVSKLTSPGFGMSDAANLHIVGNTTTPTNVVITGICTFTPESVSGTETAGVYLHSNSDVTLSGMKINPTSTTKYAIMSDGQRRTMLDTIVTAGSTNGLGIFHSHLVLTNSISITGWTNFGTWTALQGTLETSAATSISLTPSTLGAACLHFEIGGMGDMESATSITCPGGSNNVTTFLDADTNANVWISAVTTITAVNLSTPSSSAMMGARHGAGVFIGNPITATNFTYSCSTNEEGHADQGGGRTFTNVGGTSTATSSCVLF